MSGKTHLIERIRETLAARVAAMESAAREAQAAASDPGSKAESKYDTRSLEASYLAAGQAQQVAELAEALRRFTGFEARHFEIDEPIGSGALVELSGERESSWYLLAPAAGGMTIEFDGLDITLLTPASRLYQSLLGKTIGEAVGGATISDVR
jgi:hypothetical protein